MDDLFRAEKKRLAKLNREGMDSGPLKPRSSSMLKRKSLSEAGRRDAEAKRKFGDRGMSGYEEIKKVEGDTATQYMDDSDLIDEYGMDAPKARSFMTPKNNPDVKKLSAGGKVKAKKASKPKVRGAGKAMKGVRPAKMVTMKGA
jgi:hypothetical protein